MAERMSKLDPEFDDCPGECGYEQNETRKPFDFCEDCPVKAEKDSFRDLTEQALLASKTGCSFRDLEKDFYTVLAVENLPREKQSVKTATLLKIIQSEKNRKKRIEDYNSRDK